MCRSILDDVISSIFVNADVATTVAPCAIVPACGATEDVESVSSGESSDSEGDPGARSPTDLAMEQWENERKLDRYRPQPTPMPQAVRIKYRSEIILDGSLLPEVVSDEVKSIMEELISEGDFKPACAATDVTSDTAVLTAKVGGVQAECASVLSDIDAATTFTQCAIVSAPAAAEDVDNAFKSALSDQLDPKVVDEIKLENNVIGWLQGHATRGSPQPSREEAVPALRTAYDLLRNRPAFAKRLFADGAALAGLMRLMFPSALRCIVFVMKREPKSIETIFKTEKWKPILRMGAWPNADGRTDARQGLVTFVNRLSCDDQDKILASDEIVACTARAFEDKWKDAALVFNMLEDVKKIQVRALHTASLPIC
jgi:hypothetical protein